MSFNILFASSVASVCPLLFGKMEVKATAALGEDPYQLLGKGLKADHDQLFVVVAVS